jgi:signal recognition particle receptor subunit alpha
MKNVSLNQSANGVDMEDEDEEAAAEAEMERLGISKPPMLAGLPPPSSSGPKSKKSSTSSASSTPNNHKGGNSKGSSTPSSSSSTPSKKNGGGKGNSGSESASKGGKEQRTWGTTDSFDEAKAALLDMSKGNSENNNGGSGGVAAADAALLNVQKVSFSGTGASGSGANLTDDDDDDENNEILKSSSTTASANNKSWFSRSGIGSWMSSLTGNKILTKEELEPIAETLRTHLMDKNVAKEVSDNLCDSLVQQLDGTKLEAGLTALTVHAKITAAVKSALRRSIERILTPKKSVDLLRDVRAKKSAVLSNGQHAPFVLVFCGVNGVGKSTTLSKTAFHLKDNGFSVLIAACDSFRAGAVEQLKRHCAALDVPLYQQGYAKDPVAIASDAIKKAKDDKIDVVLIDTAGRMQNNQALMQQLARLVAVNKPDLVLFVGEALVGNDGVDQLVEFDRRLVDHAVDSASPRRIDGIVLTKFDTVDDKVGAALSMVYRTGIPVVFLGTGQQYPDLRRMNTQAVLNALLS